MDRVKAIKVLKPLANSFVDYANITMKEEDDDIVEALEMAVEALRQPEPCGDKSYTLWKESYEELKRRMDELTSCSDTISRQQAIDAVNHICPVDTEYDCTLLDRVDVRYVLSDLPSIQPEPHWIPVSERLPEESGYYITSNEYNGVGEDFYYDGHFWSADKNAYSVIAWMPKPESYKQNK